MTIIEFILWSIAVAMVASFLLTLAHKWGIIEWMQVHSRYEIIYKMLNCMFCSCWWTCVVLSIILAVVMWNWWMLLIPFVSTKMALMSFDR